MSLLLDALKKAAQDKQKNAGQPATPAVPKSAPESAASVAAKSPDDDALTLGLEPIDAAHTDDELPLEPELELPDDLIPDDTDLALSTPQDELPPQVVVTDTRAAKPKSAAIPTVDAAAVLAAQQAVVKQRDALDLMINKSRQSSDHKRNLQIYGTIIFSVLLLLIGGSYFYISNEPAVVVATAPPAEVATPINKNTTPVVEPAPTVTTKSVNRPTSASSQTPPRRAAAATKQTPVVESVQFTKTVKADPIASLLSQAYEKFQAGDYDGANQLYTLVLQREADNRDGLLGAAAVAMKQQRYAYAREQYRKLLMLDPKDSLARAGVSAIDMDVRDESQLKFILREQPDAAHLHFALGALLASQSRWAEAQQSYFNAYVGDTSNADYAYNLAVSLDQLGQYKSAREYYQKALQLSATRRASFVTADLQARIEQISRLPDAPR